MSSFYIKANRVFTPLRKYFWIYTLLVAFGGLWYPKLGLSVFVVIFSLVTLSFFKGRYWCGNFCAHGSLFDSLLMPFSRNAKIPKFLRSKTIAVLFLLFFSFNIGRKMVSVSRIYGSAPFWDKLGFIFVMSYLMVTIFGGALSLIYSPRTWCQFCPMGVMQIISYKFGKLLGFTKKHDEKITLSHPDMCHSCGKCTRVCPMQLTPHTQFSDKNQFDHDKCIRCSTCVEHCPAGILSLEKEEEAIELNKNIDLTGYENRQKITAKILKVEKLADDINEYTFKFIKPEKVDYEPGQFILIKIQEEPLMYRAYSISSYNEDGNTLSVTIKAVPDGYGSEIVFDKFKEGMKVELEGPMGDELLIDKKADKILFVGGGIGITPFVPMAKEIVEDSNASDVKLIYGVNKQGEFLYNDYFKELAQDSDNLEYIQVVAFDDEWEGEKGFVTDVMKKLDLSEYKIYICGPPPMVNATKKLLAEKEVKEENIFYESA